MKNTSETKTKKPALTKQEVTRAALNEPSRTTFTLGDRTFPLKDLSYDQYTKFLTLLAPLADGLIGKISDRVAVSQISGIEDLDTSLFSVKDIFVYCGKYLPELVTIICQTTDPTVTVEWVKDAGKTPFKLAEIVLLQMMHNNTIKDFADFFERMLPILSRK
jgi:hypothetical protein